jgi:hypothetical protein
MTQHSFTRLGAALTLVVAAAACQDKVTGPGTVTLRSNPCLPTDTVSLQVAQTVHLDCSNGGATVTFAGNGASYLIVPQFATDQGPFQLALYSVASGTLAAAAPAGRTGAALRSRTRLQAAPRALSGRPMTARLDADRLLRARGRRAAGASALRASLFTSPNPPARVLLQAPPPPPLGSIRSFQVLSNLTFGTWTTVGAQLAYAGNNLLLYVDTLAPAGGFTPPQLTAFGQSFDTTMYPIDTTAFGPPSDIDLNGRVIMLMSPKVNGDTPAATCANSGFIAGFFDPDDFDPTNPNSNQGEVFYSIVPDPAGASSCAHSVAEVDADVPGVFLHELQHLINYSQHVVVSGGSPMSSWMDEGLSIVSEELGSLYYEQRCPPPACRADPAQLFPDSSQGFVQSLLYDSYQYALLPDTASITLNDDASLGFSWRGGAWLLMRWLGDQMGSGFYRALERGPANGIAAIEQAAGQPFPSLFADFGLALYTDSLPGLPRTTAPASNRFVSRNVKRMWARLFATAGPSQDIPLEEPVQLFPITNDTSAAVMFPGTMTYFRLDTPANAATVTIQFAAPGGAALAASLKPQLAVFRLPPGQ